MGVYVFEHTRGKVIKVGYTGHENPFNRVWRCRSGFGTTYLPASINEHEDSIEFYTLLAWFPGLGVGDERAIHRRFRPFQVTGEWYRLQDAPMIIRSIRHHAPDKSSMWPIAYVVRKDRMNRYIRHKVSSLVSCQANVRSDGGIDFCIGPTPPCPGYDPYVDVSIDLKVSDYKRSVVLYADECLYERSWDASGMRHYLTPVYNINKRMKAC